MAILTMLVASATTTPTQSPSMPGSPSTVSGNGLGQLIFLGVVVLVGFVVVFLISASSRTTIDLQALRTFSRVYSLLAVVLVAAVLAFAAVNDAARSAAYAVLGAVAGYLAGQRNSGSTVEVEPAPDGGDPDGGDPGDDDADDAATGGRNPVKKSVAPPPPARRPAPRSTRTTSDGL